MSEYASKVYLRLSEAPYDVQQQAYGLVCEADKAFVPPLSARTPEDGLSVGAGQRLDASPQTYWASIQHHALIGISDKAGALVGMMSVAQDKILPELGITATAYLSTLIVTQSVRGKGLAHRLYQDLFELAGGWSDDAVVATRTWSSNAAHLPLITKLGFTEVLRLKGDRGVGIDTVYFLKPL